MRSGESRGVISEMRRGLLDEKEWFSLREASEITGKSVHAFRLLLNRGRIEKARKQGSNGQSYWEIHRDVLNVIRGDEKGGYQASQGTSQAASHTPSQVVSIPVELYTQQQKERDGLRDGLMMYRYKFEELDRQLRLLPAPVEIIPSKLAELEHKEQELRESRQAIIELEAQLLKAAENEQALARSQEAINALEEALQREKKRSWWNRLWRK